MMYTNVPTRFKFTDLMYENYQILRYLNGIPKKKSKEAFKCMSNRFQINQRCLLFYGSFKT